MMSSVSSNVEFAKAPTHPGSPTHPDSDASDTSSDEEDQIVLSKQSCKPPLGALPPSQDDDDDSADGDGDELRPHGI